MQSSYEPASFRAQLRENTLFEIQAVHAFCSLAGLSVTVALIRIYPGTFLRKICFILLPLRAKPLRLGTLFDATLDLP